VCDDVSEDLLAGNVSGILGISHSSIILSSEQTDIYHTGLGFTPLAASKLTPYWQTLLNASLATNDTDPYLSFPGFAFALSRFINITTADDIEPGYVVYDVLQFFSGLPIAFCI